jgi:hypothetical protein
VQSFPFFVLSRTLFYYHFKMAFTDKQAAIIVISVLFPLTAVLLVGLRLRARVLTSERIKADDYWIVTAVVSFGCRVTFEEPFLTDAGAYRGQHDPVYHQRLSCLRRYSFQILYTHPANPLRQDRVRNPVPLPRINIKCQDLASPFLQARLSR